MGERRYYSTIFDLCIRWSLALQPLYPLEKELRNPLDGRPGGPQIRSRRCGVQKNHAFAGNATRVVQPVARRYTDGSILSPQHTYYCCNPPPQIYLKYILIYFFRTWNTGSSPGDRIIPLQFLVNMVGSEAKIQTRYLLKAN
jgi:hypothetical protein